MKIAIYGVSRSGKDYFIGELVETFKEYGKLLVHIPGSKTLNEISYQTYGKCFKENSEAEKEQCRKLFIDKINELDKEYDYVVVDGHYSFYDSDMHLKRFFSTADLFCYDQFFYLDTEPSIIENRYTLKESKDKTKYKAEEIESWIEYEIVCLTEELVQVNKELHILNGTEEDMLKYAYEVTQGQYDSYELAMKMIDRIKYRDNVKTVILVDCDKTLSIEDTTDLALEYHDLDGTVLKKIYRKDRYSNFQAVIANEYLVKRQLFSNDCKNRISESIHLNEPLIENLKKMKNVAIFGITAGNSLMWQELLNMTGLVIEVLASSVMSKYIKMYAVKHLQNSGKYVVAIGDSLLDSYMLKYSNKSYIVANKGIRRNVRKFLDENKHVHQLEYSKYQYEDVSTEPEVNLINTLDSDNDTVAENIKICKSDSGVEGVDLRKAHYFLGMEVAEKIKCDFPCSQFVVLILMRSGLPFGQGIADKLDATEVFYSEGLETKFENEFIRDERYKGKKIIVCDGVINLGNTIRKIIALLSGYEVLVATNVLSQKFTDKYEYPIYTSRLSERSFIGAKQKIIKNGYGPDTSDRLFRTM